MAESNITTCYSCNSKIRLNSKFCSKCGTKLNDRKHDAEKSSEKNPDTYELKTIEKNINHDMSKHELFKAIGIGLCIGLFLLLLIVLSIVIL